MRGAGDLPLAAAAAPRVGSAAEPWLVALLALGGYLLLGHDCFYKTDGPDLAWLCDEHFRRGEPLVHPWHPGALRALDGFRRLLLLVGLQPDYLQLGAWWSAGGAAAGLGLLRAGCRALGVRAAAARAAVLLAAVNPGTLLFATVVEYHGPLLLPLGLCFWWLARQVAQPSWWGMAALALPLHLAFLMHGQAVLHAAWLLPFFLARRRGQGTPGRDLGQAALAGCLHLGLVAVLPRLRPADYGFWADLGRGLAAEGSIGRPQSLDWTPTIFAQEWLWPLMPLSYLVLAVPQLRPLRAEFAAFALGCLPYLYVSVRQLVHEPEHGAYLLPMVWPAALLVAQAVRGGWLAALLVTALVGAWPRAAVEQGHFAQQREFDRRFAAAVRDAAGSATPFVLVGSHREMAACYATLGVRAAPRDPLTEERFLWLRALAAMPRAAATPDRLAETEGFLRLLLQQGRAVLLTTAGLASLDDPRAAMLAEKATLRVDDPSTMAGPLFAAHLRARFDLQPAAPGLLRLLPKP